MFSSSVNTILCNQCGVEEIHHDTHLLVRYSKRSGTDFWSISGSVEQQLWAFHEKTEKGFERVTKDNDERIEKLRKEMNELRKDVQERLGRIEDLLRNAGRGNFGGKSTQ